MNKTDTKAIKACDANAGYHELGRYYNYFDGQGVSGKIVSKWNRRACFSHWQYQQFDTITWFPRIARLNIPAKAEALYRVGWNDVLRKIFKTMPTYYALRKSNDLEIKAVLKDIHLIELNFRWRWLRSFHEEPTVISGCGWLRWMFPDAPASVLATIAAGACINKNGLSGVRQIILGHTTVYVNCLTSAAILARVLEHISKHKGCLFTGRLKKKIPVNNMSYSGVDTATTGNKIISPSWDPELTKMRQTELSKVGPLEELVQFLTYVVQHKDAHPVITQKVIDTYGPHFHARKRYY